MSEEQQKFYKNVKRKKILILFTQVFIIIFFILLWEILAKYKLINTFITSSPSHIFNTFKNLLYTNQLWNHVWVTFSETIIAFLITTFSSILISIILYESDFLSKVFDPYLTLLNSLPKVALGPILIIWIGANNRSIVTMAVLISIVVSIQSIFNGFKNTDKNKIKLLRTFGANKRQVLFKVVIPSNYVTIINTLKINISMCLVGRIDIWGEHVFKKSRYFIVNIQTIVINNNLINNLLNYKPFF